MTIIQSNMIKVALIIIIQLLMMSLMPSHITMVITSVIVPLTILSTFILMMPMIISFTLLYSLQQNYALYIFVLFVLWLILGSYRGNVLYHEHIKRHRTECYLWFRSCGWCLYGMFMYLCPPMCLMCLFKELERIEYYLRCVHVDEVIYNKLL